MKGYFTTTLVRQIMYQHNRKSHNVWTNKYKTMRTVKCYGRSNKMEADIRAALEAHGIDYKIRTTRNPRATPIFGHSKTATIVQLPLEETIDA